MPYLLEYMNISFSSVLCVCFLSDYSAVFNLVYEHLLSVGIVCVFFE